MDAMEFLVIAALLVLASGTEMSILQDTIPAAGTDKLTEDGFEPPQLPFGYHSSVGVTAATRVKQAEQNPLTRIVGGLPTLNSGQYPFFGGLIITLESAATSVCGSSLLSSKRLLTAAHCWWDGKDYAYTMQAVLGSSRLFAGGVRALVVYVASHAQYVPGDVDNDIAILSIPPVAINKLVKPISLPMSVLTTYEGYTATAIGYGRYSDSSPSISSFLRSVLVPVISNEQCSAEYGEGLVTSAVLCTSGEGGRGPCGGDSGGPLVYTNKAGRSVLIGVTNFVASSGCSSGFPSGYVRVTHHKKWIRSQM